MRTIGRYRLNPAPAYVMGVFNPVKRKPKKIRRKNSAKKRAGMWLAKRPTRNPKSRKRAHRKVKNPLTLKHVLLENPRKKRRKISRNCLPIVNPMSKKRSHKKKQHKRNPMSRRHRKHTRRMRNPMGAIREVFPTDLLVTGLAALGTNVGLNTLQNWALTPNTDGSLRFKIPGVSYPGTNGITAATFYQQNGYILAFWKALLGGAAAYFTRNQGKRLSQGIALGTVITAGSDVARTANFVSASGALQINRGTSAFLPRGRGAQTYIPGVPPLLSGPATAFINNGAPVARMPMNRGTNAIVDRRWAAQTTQSGPDPFKAN